MDEPVKPERLSQSQGHTAVGEGAGPALGLWIPYWGFSPPASLGQSGRGGGQTHLAQKHLNLWLFVSLTGGWEREEKQN